ncbi:MAG: secretin N-terminal domain-containing protein [Planctomycetaceae bacterium]
MNLRSLFPRWIDSRRLCSAACLASLFGAGIVGASDNAPGVFRLRGGAQPTVSKIAGAETKLRLQYLSAPWDRVLTSVAADAGLTLVMHDTPHGRFSRNDLQQHSIPDAIRILNQELEPIGFRCIANEQFLTVIKSERARVEFPRRELGSTSQQPAAAPRVQGGGIQTAGYEAGSYGAPGILRTSGETPAAQPAPASTNPLVAGTTKPVTVPLAAQNRPAVEISRDIYAAFQARATVQDVGPNGLPSFTVWRDAPKGDHPGTGEWFTVELDVKTNRMLLTADERVAAGLSGLVKRLDTRPRTEQEATRLVAGDETLPGIGRELQPQLRHLKANGAAPVVAAAWQQGNVGDNAGPATIPGTAPGNGDGSATAAIPGFTGNLRGDVTIQSVDDLNLLIIRGNETDVEQVMQVIQMIEQQAQGSQPEINVVSLKHVSSEALSELLQDVYERINEQQEEGGRAAPPISVIPVVQPNAIIIMAPSTAMESIMELATTLDQPSDPAAEVQVLALKHAIASQVVDLLDQFYEDRGGLGTRVRAIADVRTNSIIVQARPRELAEIS